MVRCVQPSLANDIFNKNLGVLLEQVNGVINTGNRDLKIHLFDTFNHTVNDQHSSCTFANNTRIKYSKSLFRKMADELFVLHGYKVKHTRKGTVKTTTMKPTVNTTVSPTVNNRTEAAYMDLAHVSSFRGDRPAMTDQGIIEQDVEIIKLEEEINDYVRNNSDTIERQCNGDCIYFLKNLEMFAISMNSESEKHVRIRLLLPLSEDMLKTIDENVMVYQKNWTEVNQLVQGVHFGKNLLLIAFNKGEQDQEFDLSAIVEGSFLVIRMEAVIKSNTLIGSVAWTKQYEVENISITFTWQDMMYGYLDLEYDPYNYYDYLDAEDEDEDGQRENIMEEDDEDDGIQREDKSRKKRNIFNIAYLDDVDEKINTAMRIATQLQIKNFDNLNKQSIAKLSDLVKTNGIAIAQQGNTISNLIGTICMMKDTVQEEFVRQDLKLHLAQIINHLLEVLHDCRKGNFPQSLINFLLEKLCRLHIKKEKCIWAKPLLREFISCSLGTIYIGSEHIMINLSLNVPQNLQDHYKLFRPYAIPVFYNNSATKINDLKGNMILEWSDPPEYQILSDCKEYKRQFICGTKSNTTPGLLNCVNGIVKNIPSECPMDSFKPQNTCFVTQTRNGILVSTKTPIAVHKEDRRRIFQSKTSKIKGTEFISNQKNVVKSINCDDVTVYTSQSEEVDVKVVHNVDFEWDAAWKGGMSRFNLMEKAFERRQNSINNHLKDLNMTVDEIKNDMKPNNEFILEYIPEKEKSKKLMLGVVITLVSLIFVGTSILFIYCKYCKRKKYSIGKASDEIGRRIAESESERINRVSMNQRVPYDYPIVKPIKNEEEMRRLEFSNRQSTFI